MNFIKLEYFVVLAEEENVSKAASKLFITQPALSLAISSIENEVGAKLFDKNGRNIVLNDNGKLFYKTAKDILKEYNSIVQKINTNIQAIDNTITLAGAEFEASKTITANYNHHKKRQIVRLIGINYNEIPEALSDGQIDFIISSCVPEYTKSYEKELMLTSNLFLVVSKNHPLASRDTISIKEVKKEQFVMLGKNRSYRHYIDEIFDKAGYKPTVVLEVYSGEQLAQDLNISNHITILTSFFMEEHNRNEDLKFIKLIDSYCYFELFLIWNKNKKYTDQERDFKDYVINNGINIIKKV